MLASVILIPAEDFYKGTNVLTIKIIRPSSRESGDGLAEQVGFLQSNGFSVDVEDCPSDESWTYSAGSAADRTRILAESVLNPKNQIILCARGGYGASDLLPLLPWHEIKQTQPKLICGFSDISALHAAFYSIAGWPGLHGPMPATSLWRKNGDQKDIDVLLKILVNFSDGKECSSEIGVSPRGEVPSTITGTLFGGCFTVLSNLIGTPYMPASLTGHILFIEDTDENPARLIRTLNQWQQSGNMKGVRALIVGHLRSLGESIPDCADYVYNEFARRVGVPVFSTAAFGHTSPNMPMLLGANAAITQGRLSWHYGHKQNA